jgi:hypothetical protein
MNIAGKTVSIGAIVAAVGGVVAAVGALLVWYSMTMNETGLGQSVNVSVEAKGTDSTAGLLALVLGIVVVVLVVASVQGVKIPSLSLAFVAIGVVILVLLAVSFFTNIFPVHFTATGGANGNLDGKSVKDGFDEFNKAFAAAKLQAASVPGLTVSGGAGPGIGFILDAIAGILMIVGGGLGLMKKSA